MVQILIAFHRLISIAYFSDFMLHNNLKFEIILSIIVCIIACTLLHVLYYRQNSTLRYSRHGGRK
jgi:hypothetical protein